MMPPTPLQKKLIIRKTTALRGAATLPGSKSQAIRALLIALMAEGTSTLYNLPDSEDVKTAIRVCQQLGAHITSDGDKHQIISQGLPIKQSCCSINSGNSGVTTRFIIPMLGLRHTEDQPITLACGTQMRHRPIHPLVDALRTLGLNIEYITDSERLPIKISGKLRGGKASLKGTSSQYISALLLSLPCAERDSLIEVKHLNERPYVAMSLDWLNQQRLLYEHHRSKHKDFFWIKGRQQWQPYHKRIAGDFSSAACLIAASVLIPSHVLLHGIDMKDPQGDKHLIDILKQMGAHITIQAHQNSLTLQGRHSLHGGTINANDIPDLLPVLAVIATQASGKTRISHVAHARIKETDRIHSMAEGLQRMGAKLLEEKDGLTIYPSKLHGTTHLNGYNDHRTVMALALAGLLADGETSLTKAEAMNKTFPQFVDILQSLGAKAAWV